MTYYSTTLQLIYKEDIINWIDTPRKNINKLDLFRCNCRKYKPYLKRFIQALISSDVENLSIDGVLNFQFVIDLFLALPKTKIKSLYMSIECWDPVEIKVQNTEDNLVAVMVKVLPKLKLTELDIDQNMFSNDNLVILTEAITKMPNLKSFRFSEMDDIATEHKILDKLEDNIMIEEINMLGSFSQMVKRNRWIQNNIKQSIITFIAIRKYKKSFMELPLDIIILIAKYLFSTRRESSTWLIK